MTISNSGSDERGKITGGKAGDQTGGEWRVRSWYQSGWDCVLRHPNAAVRALIADMAEAAARNDRVGYDQLQRLTFWNQLSTVGHKPERITVACEADCSSGVAAIVKGAGYRLGFKALMAVDHTSYTGNLRARLKAAGFEVLTASKYLKSDACLMRGDILLNDVGGGHTCINLTTGGKAETTNNGGDTVKIELSVLKKGSKGEQVKTLQRLLKSMGYNIGSYGIDGVFGNDTSSAVIRFQSASKLETDAVVGVNTWNALLK